MSTYYNARFCKNCLHELTQDEALYSNGRCPLCGFQDPNACTIVETFSRGYWVESWYDPPKKWWQFWRRRPTVRRRIFDAPGEGNKPVPRLPAGDICMPGYERPRGFGFGPKD